MAKVDGGCRIWYWKESLPLLQTILASVWVEQNTLIETIIRLNSFELKHLFCAKMSHRFPNELALFLSLKFGEVIYFMTSSVLHSPVIILSSDGWMSSSNLINTLFRVWISFLTLSHLDFLESIQKHFFIKRTGMYFSLGWWQLPFSCRQMCVHGGADKFYTHVWQSANIACCC